MLIKTRRVLRPRYSSCVDEVTRVDLKADADENGGPSSSINSRSSADFSRGGVNDVQIT